MPHFTVKTPKDTWEYEICDYPYRDSWQYLKITGYHKGKYHGEESVDLSEINPEFLELKSEKLPLVPLILAWCGVAFFAGVTLAMVFALLGAREQLITAASTLFVPLAVGVYSLKYIIGRRKCSDLSTFLFCDEESGRFQIPYTKNSRAETCAFAQRIAACCNQGLCEENELPIVTHQFANGRAELCDNRILLYNAEGIKCGDCDYISVVPGVHHHRETHIIRNFFCILTAFCFWFGTLIFIIGSALTLKERELIFGFSIMYIIPFVLGHFFFSKCKKSLNYYFAGGRSEESGEIGIYLEVGKNPGSEKDFIAELNRRLRRAYEEDKQNSDRIKKQMNGTKSDESSS